MIYFFYAGYLEGNILAVFLALLPRQDAKETIQLASRAQEVVALDVFTESGWRSNINFGC
jgi:hypothetical protein